MIARGIQNLRLYITNNSQSAMILIIIQSINYWHTKKNLEQLGDQFTSLEPGQLHLICNISRLSPSQLRVWTQLWCLCIIIHIIIVSPVMVSVNTHF